jgi:hypothetical protein
MVFCDSALLSHHTTFEFHGGAPGHALHSGRYQICGGFRSPRAATLDGLLDLEMPILLANPQVLK